MKFLVAGGAGYIGSHFIAEAKRQGHTCVALDNLSRGHRWAVEGTELIEADVLDTAAIKAALQCIQPDVVLHYAAFALVPESVEHPELYYRNNVLGTKSLLDAMVAINPNIPLVFSSTCAVYGTPKELPVMEHLPRLPESPYGNTKLGCEQLIEDYTRAYAMRAMALRYFNASGADAGGKIGEDHEPETHLIPNIILRALKNETVTIFGNDYPTRDGTCIRDYIHVTDLAESHILAAAHLVKAEKKFFGAMNIGSGTGYSNLEVVQTVEKVLDRPVKVQYASRRPGDAAAIWANPAAAQKNLGFKAKHSSLENICRTALAWHQKH